MVRVSRSFHGGAKPARDADQDVFDGQAPGQSFASPQAVLHGQNRSVRSQNRRNRLGGSLHSISFGGNDHQVTQTRIGNVGGNLDALHGTIPAVALNSQPMLLDCLQMLLPHVNCPECVSGIG